MIWGAVRLLILFVGFSVVLLSLLLLVSTSTLAGSVVGSSLILIWVGVLIYPNEESKRAIVAKVTMAAGVLGLVSAFFLVPSGASNSDASFRSIYEKGVVYRKWTPSHLVPEVDQLMMGTKLFPWIDSYFDGPNGDRLGESIQEIYGELREDPEFSEVGNVLGLCYESVLIPPEPNGHRYEYIPKSASEDGPIPVIVFLHGSLGNFKGYLWVWKEFADRNGVAIVAPSFGIGEWRDGGGRRSIREVVKSCKADPRFDTEEIYMSGISNGGAGVTFGLSEVAESLAGVIYLSPVIEPRAAANPQFLSAIEYLPVLLISGAEDRRVPKETLQRSIESIKKAGTAIEYHFIENEDHFLFFYQRDQVVELMSDWFTRVR